MKFYRYYMYCLWVLVQDMSLGFLFFIEGKGTGFMNRELWQYLWVFGFIVLGSEANNSYVRTVFENDKPKNYWLKEHHIYTSPRMLLEFMATLTGIAFCQWMGWMK